MAKRLTPSQIRSRLRRAQQKQRQAVNEYNADVRKHNRDAKRAVDNHNREVRAHNAKVRQNRTRLNHELRRLNASSTTTTTVRVPYRQSATRLNNSFEQLTDARPALGDSDVFLDLAEGETANSVHALNELQDGDNHEDSGRGPSAARSEQLQESRIGDRLASLSDDLRNRWHGALFALSPRNPDAARHFCTSSREILTSILEQAAPDEDVLTANPTAARTDTGRVTRRAKVTYCLERRGEADSAMISFVEDDIDDVIALFREFNDATHGSAGRFPLGQLSALKVRVEDAILFLATVL